VYGAASKGITESGGSKNPPSPLGSSQLIKKSSRRSKMEIEVTWDLGRAVRPRFNASPLLSRGQDANGRESVM